MKYQNINPVTFEGLATVIIVHPGQRAEVDGYLNVALEVPSYGKTTN